MRRVLVVVTLLALTAGLAVAQDEDEAPVGARFIDYYLTAAEIIAEHQDDPAACGEVLGAYYAEITEDFIFVTNVVNEFSEEERAAFMGEFMEPLGRAMDLYWETAFSPAGESDAVFELLETIPMLNLMALAPYFPPAPEEKKP